MTGERQEAAEKMVLARVDAGQLTRRIFWTCVVIELVLVVADLVLNYGQILPQKKLRRIVNIAREDSIATWFMVFQCMLTGLVLLFILKVKSRRIRPWRCWAWGFFAFFFVYLSVDDTAQIHERLGAAFSHLHKNKEAISAVDKIASWFPSYGWQLAVLPILVAIGLLLVFFTWSEFTSPKARRLLLAAVVVMAAAQGLDFMEGLDKGHPWNFYTWLRHHYDLHAYTVYHLSRVIEEFSEMLSISIFLRAFITHLMRNCGDQLQVEIHHGTNERY